MNLLAWSGPLAYVGVFLATVIEGEIVFVGASVLVYTGHLDWFGVFVAAALGGSVGDQLYFYLLRGRLRGWLDRFPSWTHRRDRILHRVRENASAMILACRFLPGLRVAIPAACAYAGISPVRFTTLSLLSSVGWAAAVMGFVTWLGPASLSELGLRAWWAPVIPAVVILAFSYWLGKEPKEPTPRPA